MALFFVFTAKKIKDVHVCTEFSIFQLGIFGQQLLGKKTFLALGIGTDFSPKLSRKGTLLFKRITSSLGFKEASL